jgi:hypothetical protein
MNRSELERLDRDTLIARAESSGVGRARIDELLLKSAEGREEVQRVRGLFGRARDLLARVIERGLHLPDAADRLRGRSAPPPPPLRSTAAPLPTVTLAEIYAAQGHRDRAVETLKNVIAREPEHAAARGLLDRLEDDAYDGPKPRPLPPEDEPLAPTLAPKAVVEEPARVARDVDECVAIPVSQGALFVYWRLGASTRGHLEATRPGGAIALRVLVVSPTWEGPESAVRDVDVGAAAGEVVVQGLPSRAVVRAALGWRIGEDFVALAHSPALEASGRGEADDVLLRWTPRGTSPVATTDRDAPSIERALEAARAHVAARA